jgi:ribosomal protein S10
MKICIFWMFWFKTYQHVDAKQRKTKKWPNCVEQRKNYEVGRFIPLPTHTLQYVTFKTADINGSNSDAFICLHCNIL